MFTKNGNKYFISSHGESSNRSSRKLMEHDTYLTKLKWNSKGNLNLGSHLFWVLAIDCELLYFYFNVQSNWTQAISLHP